MGDEQGTATAVPVTVDLDHPAVEAELIRLVRAAMGANRGPTAWGIIRTAFPQVDRVRWARYTGNPLREADVDLEYILARQPDYTECCEICTRDHAALLRRRFEAETPVPAPVPEPPRERTCRCEACDAPECQGDCEQCDDHDCEQCGCGPNEALACCGYCPECTGHAGDGRDERCDQGHCHECEHRCEDW